MAQGLGLAGPAGLAAAFAALEQLRRDRQMREQQVIENDLAGRRVGVAEGGLEVDRGRLGESTRQFDLGHGENVRQFNAMEPTRIANVHRLDAETRDLGMRPFENEADRQTRLRLPGIEHGFAMQRIGAEGGEARRTLAARAALEAAGSQEGPSPYQSERSGRTVQSVQELKKKVSPWTTGYGSLLSYLPATDATNFAAELDTLKANIAFSELTAMREASKTGGALGSVSDKEMGLLTSALGALNAKQSPANFLQQLQKIEDSITRWNTAVGLSGAGAGVRVAPPPGVDRRIGGRFTLVD